MSDDASVIWKFSKLVYFLIKKSIKLIFFPKNWDLTETQLTEIYLFCAVGEANQANNVHKNRKKWNFEILNPRSPLLGTLASCLQAKAKDITSIERETQPRPNLTIPPFTRALLPNFCYCPIEHKGAKVQLRTWAPQLELLPNPVPMSGICLLYYFPDTL